MRGQAINIAALANMMLAGIIDHYAAAGDSTLPARRLVVPGESRTVAWDCEQLTVSLVGVGWGQALDMSSPSASAGPHTGVTALRHAVLAATLVRCTPVPAGNKAPTVAALQAAGDQYMRDAGLLSQALVELCSRIRQGLPSEAKVQPGAVEPIGPSGMFHALETTLAVTASRLE